MENNYPSLLVAIPTYDGKLLAEAVVEILQLQGWASYHNVDVAFTYLSGCALVDIVRNSLAHTFRNSGYQKVLMIDSDIVFKWQDVVKLLEHSKKHAVVGATYPSRVELAEPKFRFYVRPLDTGPEYTEEGLLQCKGFGAGFLMVDRTVFDTLEPHVEAYPGGQVHKGVVGARTTHHNFFPIGFDEDGEHHGEDYGFLLLCNKYGIPVVLDYTIGLGHVGAKQYRAPAVEALLALGWNPPLKG